MQELHSKIRAARRDFAWLVAASSILVCQHKACSDEPSPQKDMDSIVADELRSESNAEMKIRKAMQEPTVLEFIETPLIDVIDFLEDQHGIQIELATTALDAVGIGSDTPITRDLKGVTLRSALKLMLKELELTYIIDGGVLQITTPEYAEASVVTRVYNVGDLLGEKRSVDELAEVMTIATATHSHDSGTVLGFGNCLVATVSYPRQHRIARLLALLRSALGSEESDLVQNSLGLFPVNKEHLGKRKSPTRASSTKQSDHVELTDQFGGSVSAASKQKLKRDPLRGGSNPAKADPFRGGAEPFGRAGEPDPSGGAYGNNPFGKAADPFRNDDEKRK